MKLFYTTLLFLSVCAAAFAQDRESETVIDRLLWDADKLNIMVDTRVDYRASFPDRGGKELGFEAQTIKLWLVGEIVPGVRYRLRHRLNKPQAPLREGYSSATDHAWVAIDLGKRRDWTLTVGKQSIMIGTYEFDYNPADVYLSTMVNNDIDGYKTGINVAYRFAGQTLNLQVVNSDAPQFARDDYKNKAAAAHFLWDGSLWAGAVKTRIGYSVLMHTKTKYYNWFTPGVQFNGRRFRAELDYYYGTRQIDYGEQMELGIAGYSYVRDQSASVNFAWDFGKLRPALKGIWDNRFDKDLSRDAYRNLGIQAVLEYYPFTNKYLKDLRFHIMYSYTDTNYFGPYSGYGNDGTHTALAGMRWLFKAK